MDIRDQLENLFTQAIEQAVQSGALALEISSDSPLEPSLERPRDESHGDWASTVAMRSAKLANKNPREVAQIIIDHLPANDMIDALEIAGPGFINIRLSKQVLQQVVTRVREEANEYGRSEVKSGPRFINLEYISANPTGPMHVGHGRWAALGDALARVMRHAGYEVFEEFYVNDHGVQMDIFGNSVAIRYQQLLGVDVSLPENSYGGSYVKDIAQEIIDRDGDRWLKVSAKERAEAFREIAYEAMLGQMKATVSEFGVSFDRWFSERDLYTVDAEGQSAVSRAFNAMSEKGYIYEAQGATWFRSTVFGDDKDRVLIKENGEYTYFMSDMAYHYDKVMRGYDLLIDIWGADHHGYVKRCEAMMEAWGHPGALEVVLGQLVNLFRNGEVVRMSKRIGEMVTFKELMDEVGVDATRYLMLSRSSDQAIDFDIELAKKKDATNPVYYVQYAHARICSILRKAADQMGMSPADADNTEALEDLACELISEDVDLSLLTHETELALLRKLDDFKGLVAQAARDRAPFRLTHYANDLAALFHQFYTQCHVLADDMELQQARLALVDACRIVLALTLSLLGVSAPTRM